eukprot:Partr_v1_DN28152_c0_g1_i2_m55324 putative helicase 1
MYDYNVKEITVKFPYAAYDCQLDFMRGVVSALQGKENALLESPTGTGKTCSLLCSSLAWLEAYKALKTIYSCNSGHEIAMLIKDEPMVPSLMKSVSNHIDSEDFINDPLPRIYYASRTHSQLTQVVRELQNTAYKDVNICVLGSREQMCIEKSVRELSSNSARTAVCRSLVSQKRCQPYTTVQSVKHLTDSFRSLDMEELVKFGQRHTACPYYLSRELQAKADIIFVPYNYLIDPTSRASQHIDLKNSIIIFDEAHNLESICSEATSFEITPLDIATSIEELDSCKSTASESDVPSARIEVIKLLLLKFEEVMDALEMSAPLIMPGTFIFELFGKCNVRFSNSSSLIQWIDSVTMHIGSEFSVKRNQNLALRKMLSALRTIFNPQNELKQNEFAANYKVYIEDYKPPKTGVSMWNARKGRTVSMWCFSSGVAMNELMEKGCRSVILTSGTLSPLNSFAAEMNLPFHHVVENPHVIHDSQIFVGVVPRGPSGHVLNSSFKNRDLAAYKTDLGNVLVNFCRVIPDGVLVFFPSYGNMDQCVQEWMKPNANNQPSLWQRIKQLKEPFVEPKEKTEFGKAMETFYEKVNDKTIKGAIFFAVCRGKASEGIDFSDTRGRAVVITGIPYPAFKDQRVTMKRQFLDDKHASNTRNSKIITINGETWYKQQAARAVNQAVGRVIRHRNDWGAILLCDDRFLVPGNRNQLPLWIRPHVRNFSQFGESQSQLSRFMRRQTELEKEKENNNEACDVNVGVIKNEHRDNSNPGGHLDLMKSDFF